MKRLETQTHSFGDVEIEAEWVALRLRPVLLVSPAGRLERVESEQHVADACVDQASEIAIAQTANDCILLR